MVRKCVSHYQKCDLTIPLPQVGVSQWVGGIGLASYLKKREGKAESLGSGDTAKPLPLQLQARVSSKVMNISVSSSKDDPAGAPRASPGQEQRSQLSL